MREMWCVTYRTRRRTETGTKQATVNENDRRTGRTRDTATVTTTRSCSAAAARGGAQVSTNQRRRSWWVWQRRRDAGRGPIGWSNSCCQWFPKTAVDWSAGRPARCSARFLPLLNRAALVPPKTLFFSPRTDAVSHAPSPLLIPYVFFKLEQLFTTAWSFPDICDVAETRLVGIFTTGLLCIILEPYSRSSFNSYLRGWYFYSNWSHMKVCATQFFNT